MKSQHRSTKFSTPRISILALAGLLSLMSMSAAATAPTITFLGCGPLLEGPPFSAECMVNYQSSSPVQIRWVWGGFPLPTWDDSWFAAGGCSDTPPYTQVSVEVINAHGSDTQATTINRCRGFGGGNQ